MLRGGSVAAAITGRLFRFRCIAISIIVAAAAALAGLPAYNIAHADAGPRRDKISQPPAHAAFIAAASSRRDDLMLRPDARREYDDFASAASAHCQARLALTPSF